MGLIETLGRGIVLSQKTTPTGLITLPPSPVAVHSGSVDVFGGTFVLLGVTGQRAGRIRLYSDQASMDLDDSRAVGDFNINDGVGLISDIVLTTTMSLTFNPPLLGASHDIGNIWYKISGSAGTINNIVLTYHPLTDIGDTSTDRSTLIISGAALPTGGNGISGSIITPNSFLILSGSANVKTRLRLYSGQVSEIPTDEPVRSFSSLPSSSAKLIADMMFDSASYAYKLTPILEAHTWDGTSYTVGTGEVSYIMKNESAGVSNVTASLQIFSIED